MTTELQAHSKALEEQTTKSARDVAILNEKDEEYARQGQAKSKEVRAVPAAAPSSSLLGVTDRCLRQCFGGLSKQASSSEGFLADFLSPAPHTNHRCTKR